MSSPGRHASAAVVFSRTISGEFMPESVKQAKLARRDKTIERPARKISMSDEKPLAPLPEQSAQPQESAATAPDTEAQAEPTAETAEQPASSEAAPLTEPPQEEKKEE